MNRRDAGIFTAEAQRRRGDKEISDEELFHGRPAFVLILFSAFPSQRLCASAVK
jgi:hypothetical protein